MSETRKNPYNVQGISFESEALLNDAKKRAKSFGISLSNYVNQLVKNDLDDSESTIVRARPQPAQYAPPAGDALNESAAESGVDADNLRRLAVNNLPGSPVKPPAPERQPEESEGSRSRRKFVGTVRRGAAAKEDRREKREK